MKSIFQRETRMALRATTIGSTDPTQPGTAVEESERLLQSTHEQEIRNRAYEIYLQSGTKRGYQVPGEPQGGYRYV